MRQIYLDTAKTLVQAAPHIFHDETFALKGGTAINLFYRDMPRLSVDLDLMLPDHTLTRDQALKLIDTALAECRKRLAAAGFAVDSGLRDAEATKIFLSKDNIVVKVEANYVMRGSVHPPTVRSLTDMASDMLLADIDIPVVSLEDVYGGKIAAALDRQHPRDLFDVLQLFANEGLTPAIRRAFVVYLTSHKRPFHEVLFPTLRDITYEYAQHFDGMTAEPVPIENLLHARARLIRELHVGIDANERAFLISLASAEPAWHLLDIPHLSELPAVRWKLENLQRLREVNSEKFQAQLQALASRLG